MTRNSFYNLNNYSVILIDGGTDALMCGDEENLGTPNEDLTSIAALDLIQNVDKYLLCIGFGIDQ